MSKVSIKISRFIEKHFYALCMIALFLVVIAMRVYIAPYTDSGDYEKHLSQWVLKFRKSGIHDGLKELYGNYYVPYNLILALISTLPTDNFRPAIAAVSIAFELVGAYYLYKIAGMRMEKKKAALVSLVILMLPAAILNGAYWKQCDAIYTAISIAALYYLLRKRYRTAFIVLGIAFTFKQQMVFVLPAFIIVYFIEKYNIFYFLWIPVIYLIAGLPAILCGKPAMETWMVYAGQADQYPYMYNSYPNIYAFGLDDYAHLAKPAIMFTAGIFILASLYVHHYKKTLEGELVLELAGWSVYTCVMFLPSMHERYGYEGLILLSFAALDHERKLLPSAVFLNVMDLVIYARYLFNYDGMPVWVLALLNLAFYAYTTGVIAENLSGGDGAFKEEKRVLEKEKINKA